MKKNILRGFFIITLLSVFFVVNISKSDDTMVGYSDSKFIYNNSELSTITFTIS